MTRRRYAWDPLGDHVADKFLGEDLQSAWDALEEDDRDFIFYLLEQLDHSSSVERDYELISQVSGRIRVHPIHQVRLLAYLGRMPLGRCLWCARELKPREPGKPGRPAKYCSSNHRQHGCRARRRVNKLAQSRAEAVEG
ncbi:hypothetical protein [Nocardia cyriacigeorgica]|uniref:hypothetical protein n=1 Tax=Nocardia cyriacigeorgica TaxID=135487 RepID=UPI002457C5F9|nr:hypothetical protein [Nocardia cyriacigeorgica]